MFNHLEIVCLYTASITFLKASIPASLVSVGLIEFGVIDTHEVWAAGGLDGFSRRSGVLGKRICRLEHLKGLKGVLVTSGWVSWGWAERSRDSDKEKLEDSGGLKVKSGPNSVLSFPILMVWFGS